MIDVRHWLEARGLQSLADVFEANDIDSEVLFELTDHDLRELGLTLGLRKKVLKAVAESNTDGDFATDVDRAPVSSKNIDTAPGAPQDAERRQLTVMFVDLVGSTALSSQLDPEELRAVMTAYQNTVAGAVTRYEGVVAKYMGDGVLAYFGWPRAHEDDAERAVRTASAVMEAMGELATPDGAPLQARVGIATGLVVVGDLIGEGAAQEEAVVGETPNLAARLQDLAESGEVVISDTTRRLIANAFELRDIGRHGLKGIAGRTPAFVVTRERLVESRFEARLSGEVGEMVGRDHELGLILERWNQSRSGNGQLLLLIGEAGIGKSRITRATIESLQGSDHARISYQCSPYHTDSALYPAVQQLTHVTGITPADSNDDKLDKLEAVLLVDEKQIFANLLDLSVEERYGPLDSDPQQLRRRTLRALADELIALSRRQPVLFVLEDAHWIDATTLEMIELCLDKVADARVLMLVTARPTFEHPFSGHPIVTQLALNRLSREQIAVIASKLAGGKSLPSDVLEEIAQKTDGVPLFVEELTKTVLESGGLAEREDSFELTEPVSHLAIPATLHDSLMARLDRLQPVKEVAQMAACIGREFDCRLLSDISPLEEPALQNALERLMEAELIFPRGLSSDGSYIFKHALVRDAAYESLLKSKRQELHLAIARAMEREFPETVTQEPGLLGHHFSEARHHTEAITYLHQAGKLAAGRSANLEAATHYRKALSLLSQSQESDVRHRKELELQVALAAVLIAAKGYGVEETEAVFRRTFELVKNIDDAPEIFPVYYFNWLGSFVRARPLDACRVAEGFRARADQQTHLIPRLAARRTFAVAALMAGHFERADLEMREALTLFDPETPQEVDIRYGQDVLVGAFHQAGLAAWHVGRTDEGFGLGQKATARARSIGHPNTLTYGLVHTAWFEALAEDESALEETTREILSLVEKHGLPTWSIYGKAFLARSLSLQGRNEEALQYFEETFSELRAQNFRWLETTFMVWQAEVLLSQGDGRAARAVLERAATSMADGEERYFEAELHRVRAGLAKQEGDVEAAELALKEAIAVAQRQGSPFFEERAKKEPL